MGNWNTCFVSAKLLRNIGKINFPISKARDFNIYMIKNFHNIKNFLDDL